MTHNHLVPGSSPGGTTLKTPLHEGFLFLMASIFSILWSMKLGHILYKVKDLDSAVKEFSEKGFNVEYGSKENPHNALIYFSSGPYIELIQRPPVSSFSKFLLKIIGKKKLVERLNYWEKTDEGYFEICLEVDSHLSFVNKVLQEYNIDSYKTSSKRIDPANRVLKWKLLFPLENKLPFFMSKFNIDPKPKNYIHPNGISRIDKVKYGIDSRLTPIINRLCKDEILCVVNEPGISCGFINEDQH